MSAYSYDRRIPPGSYVEPVMFNLSTHPKWKTKGLDRYKMDHVVLDVDCNLLELRIMTSNNELTLDFECLPFGDLSSLKQPSQIPASQTPSRNAFLFCPPTRPQRESLRELRLRRVCRLDLRARLHDKGRSRQIDVRCVPLEISVLATGYI